MPDFREQLEAALVGRYAIQREIGAGGSAWVYLARDLRHDRDVALKVLRPALAEALGTRRFLNEIRSTAQLDHPRIATLIDSGEVDGLLFYVLPFLRGGTLRERLDREGPLPVDEALRITEQVAEALEAAHRRNILHRDIKPGNILFQDGEAMLTDFGIALAPTAPAERITEAGAWLGTPEYMSLEQATGERELDARSDIYSLAAVLYEMLAGEPPYVARSTTALIAKRMTQPVQPVSQLRPGVPPAIEAALARALAREPSDRFESVAAFCAALRSTAITPLDPTTVAVLPFIALGSDPDNEAFAEGITEDVIAHLSKLRALRVISRASVMPFKDRSLGLREIASRLQAGTVLDGSVRRAGDRVRIVVQLIDPVTGRDEWSETYDRDLTDIFAIQTDVALRIAQTLEATLSPDEQERVHREPTRNIEAYRLYRLGRHLFLQFSREEMLRSVDYFDQAIAEDPGFALAHVARAMVFLELGEMGSADPSEVYPKAMESANRALALDDRLGEAHCIQGYLKMLVDFDWAGAEAGLKRALELSPGSADTYDLYGRLCGAQRRFDEAIAHSRRAQELDPLAHRIDLATQYLRAGRHEEALGVARGAVKFDPNNARAHATVGWALHIGGEVEAGLAELTVAVALSGRQSQWLAQLGLAKALDGREAEARLVLAELEARSRKRFISPYHLAYLHTGLGEHDRAIEILGRAIDQRAGAAYGIHGSFLFTPLHRHPRYRELLVKLKLA